MENEAGAQVVALDYSQLNGAPYKPRRFRLAGESDPGDAWTDTDLPLLDPSRRQVLCKQHETSYEVKIADAIDEGLRLQQEGLNPVVSHMASAGVLAGGYHCGTTAQEQDIFKRTDYSSSLHEDLKLRLKEEHLTPENEFHPHGKFGALYSKQVVFRCGVGQDYKLMSAPAILPLIVMSDHKRDEAQRLDHLMHKQQLDLLKRMLLVCEVALHVGHTTLVFGALRCGHPSALPRQAAKLLLMALSCFHGCFRKVVFAIDNPLGSQSEEFRAYADVFGGQHRQLLASVAGARTPPTVSQPSTASDHPYCLCPVAWAHIQGNGGAASGLCGNACPWATCADHETAQLHSALFWHPPKCKNWERCESVDESSHRREFSHPPKCAALEKCFDFRWSHTSSHWHPTAWHHTRPEVCAYQSRCPHFLDQWHCNQYIHPFRSPCPSGHLCKIGRESDAEHWARHSHVCEHGLTCALLLAKDLEHIANFVHPDLALLPGSGRLQRPPCPDGRACQVSALRGEGRHRLEFAHEGEAEYYLWRKQCHRRDCQAGGNHAQKFFHKLQSIPRCPYRGINSDMDFVENHQYLSQNLAAAALDLAEKDIAEVEAWISKLRPTHRCKLEAFQSMLRLGAMVSTGIIDDIHRQSHQVVARVSQDIAEHNPVCQREYQKYEAAGPARIEQLKSFVRKAAGMRYRSAAGSCVVGSSAKAKEQEEFQEMQASLIALGVQESHLLTMAKSAEQVALACYAIKAKPDIGIGYSVDRHLNTHQNIFAILGPHTGQYYGHICLVLKRDVLFHPDTYLLANAATAFNSGDAHTNRPWCPVDPMALERNGDCEQCKRMGFETCEFKEANKKIFEQSKLHPCVQQWQRLLAQEMLGQAKHLNYEVSLKGVQRMWYEKDSHTVIEAHLPALIHFGCIEKIVMTTEQRSMLTELDWGALAELFKETSPLEYRELPRDDRHKFKPAFDQTKDLAEAPSSDLDRMGICVTLPPCDFDTRRITLLPLSLRPSAAAPVQHFSLKVNKGATFCLVLAGSARHLRDHRSAKEADFITIMLANPVDKVGTTRGHLALFMGGCLPKHPDTIFDSLRESQFRARGMSYVWNFDEGVCETDCFRSYHLRVDSCGQVLFGHYGADTFLNRKVGVYNDLSTTWLKHQIHIGVLTFNRSVSFVDMVTRFTSPPTAMSLDLMLESAQVCTEEDSCPHLYAPLDDCGGNGGTKEFDSEMLPPPSPPSWSTQLARLGHCDHIAGPRRRNGHTLLSRLRNPFRAHKPSPLSPTQNSLPDAGLWRNSIESKQEPCTCSEQDLSSRGVDVQGGSAVSQDGLTSWLPTPTSPSVNDEQPATPASPGVKEELHLQQAVVQSVAPAARVTSDEPSGFTKAAQVHPAAVLTSDTSQQKSGQWMDASPSQTLLSGPEQRAKELPLCTEALDKPRDSACAQQAAEQPEAIAANTAQNELIMSKQLHSLGTLDLPAPDPSRSELVIHKELLRLCMSDAPDPEQTELFVHKQVLPQMLVTGASEVPSSPPHKMSL